MSTQITLTVSFSKKTKDDADDSGNSEFGGGSVNLQQGKWGEKVGRVTTLDLVKALDAQLFDGDKPDIDCGMNDAESFSCPVYAYPTPSNLAFRISITNGDITGPVYQEITVRETIGIALEESVSLSYAVGVVLNIEWASDQLWDAEGNPTSPPFLNYANGEITVDKLVYGDAIITYKSTRLAYTATVSVIKDAIENVFSSSVYAVWDGGVSIVTLDPPPNAEENYLDDVNCTGGSTLILNDDDDDDPERPPRAPSGGEKVINLNYCEDFGRG